MKKLLTIFIVILLVFIPFYYSIFVLESKIKINSNVPIEPSFLLNHLGPVYLTLLPKKDVKIERNHFSIEVFYVEKTILKVKFKDGVFDITERGYLAKSDNGVFDVICNFNSNLYNLEIKNFLFSLKKMGFLNLVKYVDFQNRGIVFIDKNNIIVLVGLGDYVKKIEEYSKTVEFLKNNLKQVESIDLRFNMQAIIEWRENG